MKETGTTLWNSPNTGADNSSGFTGRPGGRRNDNGSFSNISSSAFFWSADEHDSTTAWFRNLNSGIGNVNRASNGKSVGASVRCLRN